MQSLGASHAPDTSTCPANAKKPPHFHLAVVSEARAHNSAGGRDPGYLVVEVIERVLGIHLVGIFELFVPSGAPNVQALRRIAQPGSGRYR